MALPNIWHLRTVAEASSKPCDVCYKPSTNVLITLDNKDFFYVCLGHTKDRSFCSPIIDEADAAAKKKKAELDREIESIKQEYEEKMKRKSKKAKESKDKEKEDDKTEKKDKDKNDQDAVLQKEKDEKIQNLTDKAKTASSTEENPRVYALQKVFFQKRLDRLRSIEIARRNQERLKNPTYFPAVPSGDPLR